MKFVIIFNMTPMNIFFKMLCIKKQNATIIHVKIILEALQNNRITKYNGVCSDLKLIWVSLKWFYYFETYLIVFLVKK